MANMSNAELDSLSELIEGTKETLATVVSAVPTLEPEDTSVVLPVGLWDPIDGLRDTAEVRELTGFDEEIIAKAKNVGAAMQIVLERAVVSIGGKPPEKGDDDLLTIGDRVALLIGIRRATWGQEIDVEWYCETHDGQVDVTVDLCELKSRELKDKESDRVFSVQLPSGGEAKMRYPSGKVHRQVLSGEINTGPEMTTALIVDSVQSLTGQAAVTERVAKSMSSRDRKAISDAVVDKIPGPLLEGIPAPCPECGADLEVAIPVGALFPG